MVTKVGATKTERNWSRSEQHVGVNAGGSRRPGPASGGGAEDEGGEMRVKLDVTRGPHRGKAVELNTHDTLVIGRSPDAQFRPVNRISPA